MVDVHRQWRGKLSLSLVTLLLTVFAQGGETSFHHPMGGTPLQTVFPLGMFKTEPQVWSLDQDARGLIYAGTRRGVLVYDGQTWLSVEVPGGAQALAVSGQGRVFVGGEADLGYLEESPNGELRFHSLKSQLPEPANKFSKIWQVLAQGDDIWFRGVRYLIRFKPSGAIDTFDSGSRFTALFLLDGRLYSSIKNRGLVHFIDNAWQNVPGGVSQKNDFFFMDRQGDSLLGITRRSGMYLGKDGVFEPLKTNASDYLEQNMVYGGTRISNGYYAVCTLYGGLVILDLEGNLIRIFKKGRGLPDSTVITAFEDRDGGLWLGFNQGLSRLEINGNLTRFGEAQGLDVATHGMIRHQNRMYVSAVDGLKVLETDPLEGSRFRHIEGLTDQCWSMVSRGPDLWISCNQGIYRLSEGVVSKLSSNIGNYFLLESRIFPERFYIGTDRALIIARIQGQDLVFERKIKGLPGDLIQGVEAEDGTLWLAVAAHGLLRINFSEDGETTAHFGAETFGAKGLVGPMQSPTGVLFGTPMGLFEAVDDGAGRYLPQKSTQFPFDLPHLMPLAHRDQQLMFGQDGHTILATRDDNGTWSTTTPIKDEDPDFMVQWGFMDADKTFWVGGPQGLLYFDPRAPGRNPQMPPTLIRKIQDLSDGNDLALKEATQLVHDGNGLRFQYAATAFQTGATHRYQIFLEGYDQGWSTPTEDTSKEYTNLPFGDYRFQVRATNGVDVGAVAVYSFSILKPWYHTWWARIGYAVFLLGGGLLLVRLYTARLKARNRLLQDMVAQRTRQLEAKSADLERHNLALRQGRAQIEEQARHLEHLSASQSRFFTNISHELRTPLTLILGPLDDMIRGHYGDPSDHHLKVLKRMRRHLQGLLDLIEELLEIARLNQTGMSLQRELVDLVTFVNERLTFFKPLAEEKQLTLIFEQDKVTMKAAFDRGKLGKALDNLISNGIKFTPTGGSITVELSQAENHIRLSVRDSGPGFPPEEAERVFELFYRIQDKNTRNTEGSGIGLAMVREMMALHGGTASASSQPGEGSVFTLELPLETDLAPPREDQPSDPVDESLPDPDLQDLIRGARVLVVEDNDEVRDYLRELLTPLFQVREAVDGAQALEMALNWDPDLILSDVMMPVMDGHQLCQALKQDPRVSHIPLILLTARADDRSKLVGLTHGADDYVMKPFNGQELLLRIGNQIAARERLRQRFSGEGILNREALETAPLEQGFLDKVLASIQEHLDDSQFAVSDLAGEVGLSSRQLQRKLGALTGLKPLDFIKRVRLEHAAHMLHAGGAGISEIAYAVGFENPAWFSKQFRKVYGMSPSAYAAEQVQATAHPRGR